MGVPDYILRMREHVGHELLWLPSVSAVIRNDAGELLLGRRSDDGRWSVVSGFVEPGEQPATAVVREVEEETGLRVRLHQRLATTHYAVSGTPKSVRWWRMSLVDDNGHEPDHEVDQVRWVTPEEAMRLLNYEPDRQLVRQALS
jgi:8-oxo-dGTP pyrophosphatase MutT (NUDIX family)